MIEIALTCYCTAGHHADPWRAAALLLRVGMMVMYFMGDVTMKGMMLWGVQQLGNPVLAGDPAVCSWRAR